MKMFDELSKATPTEVALTPEVANATLLASFHRTRSRRTLLKSAVAGALGATGLTVGAGTLLLSPQVTHAEAVSGSSCTIDSIKTILSVAATAERLAVTFYTNGLKEANNLGLSGASLAAIKAAQIEEQIHELFFVANGGGVSRIFDEKHWLFAEAVRNLTRFVCTWKSPSATLTP